MKAYTWPLAVTTLRLVSAPGLAGFTDTKPSRTLTIQNSLSPQVASSDVVAIWQHDQRRVVQLGANGDQVARVVDDGPAPRGLVGRAIWSLASVRPGRERQRQHESSNGTSEETSAFSFRSPHQRSRTNGVSVSAAQAPLVEA